MKAGQEVSRWRAGQGPSVAFKGLKEGLWLDWPASCLGRGWKPGWGGRGEWGVCLCQTQTSL